MHSNRVLKEDIGLSCIERPLVLNAKHTIAKTWFIALQHFFQRHKIAGCMPFRFLIHIQEKKPKLTFLFSYRATQPNTQTVGKIRDAEVVLLQRS